MSPYLESVESANTPNTNPFSSYWLETFVTTKYGNTDHAVKETNLFFALQNFLKFFPDSPILILKREPLGIFSSFIEQDLFNKWDYKERYERLKQVSLSASWEPFRFIFSDDRETQSSITILTRLLFLNSLLIAYLLNERPYKELAYESSVKDRSEVLKFLSTEIFPGKTFSDEKTSDSTEDNLKQGTFSTKRTKNKLESYLDPTDEAEFFTELNRLIESASLRFKSITMERVKGFLSFGKNQYSISGRRNYDITPKLPENAKGHAPIEYINDDHQSIKWRNTLVTNHEFCSFLNDLKKNGINNIMGCGQMFFNENMINERGGRIHFNKKLNEYEIVPGYENHPVYWVTWIGSAAFALSKGTRLPKRKEIEYLIKSNIDPSKEMNAGHKFDDVQPINIDNYTPGEINDTVGNLAVWCADGQKQLHDDPQSATRFIYGTAWNRPQTLHEITKDHSRPLIGNSRAVGIRIVKDPTLTQMSFSEVIEQLRKVQVILEEASDLSLHDVDQKIINLFNKN